jgi:hypothetical protein
MLEQRRAFGAVHWSIMPEPVLPVNRKEDVNHELRVSVYNSYQMESGV